MDALGYDLCDFVPCEISGKKANDIHHIDCRGMGGSKNQDRIEELQAITRELHEFYGDKKQHKAFLYKKHYEFLESHGVKFDKRYLMDKIKKYDN